MGKTSAPKKRSDTAASQMRVEELPPARPGRPKSREADEMLKFVRNAKGQWCRVLERDNSAAVNAHAARWRANFSADGYEFAVRRMGAVAVVFARFTGSRE